MYSALEEAKLTSLETIYYEVHSKHRIGFGHWTSSFLRTLFALYVPTYIRRYYPIPPRESIPHSRHSPGGGMRIFFDPAYTDPWGLGRSERDKLHLLHPFDNFFNASFANTIST